MHNLAQESRQPALKPLIELGRREHRAITAETYAPWLDPLPDAQRTRVLDALVLATDLYTWKLVRRDMGRSIQETRTIIRGLVDAILADAPRFATSGNDPP